ncbi:MAG: VWA domain-containing protein, partial [Kiritimatiellae bacterium]|nr:VWA domain-containing protein [Kiritimatiellia bacterium]
MTFYPLIPLWMLLLLLTLVAVATVTAFRHRNPAVAAWQHRLLVALRVASLTLALVMLLCPGQTTEERNLEKSHLVFLLDRSASMGTRDLPHGEQRLARAAAFLRDTPLRRLADYPRALYAFNHRVERFEQPDDLTRLHPEGGTDLRQAVDRVDKDIGLARVSALVLVSDGIDHSDFKGSDLTLPILSVQVGTDLAEVQDLGIESFACPDTLSEGETLTLAVPLLLNGYPTEQRVAFRVLADDVPIHTATLTLASGRLHTETVPVTFTATGIHTLR